MSIRKIDSLDWEHLWQDEMKHQKGRGTPPHNWDEHAEDFERQYSRTDYRDKMLDRVFIEPGATVMDVGCGPGNLAVPLAKRAKSVTALDISGEMLRLAKKEAEAQKASNIAFLRLDWNDAIIGKDMPPHDVVVCSRSFASQNPKESLLKLHQAAKRRVYLTLRTLADEATVFYRDLYKKVDKEYRASPDYIYGYNLLYQLGILARIDFIDYTDSFRFTKAEDAYRIMSSHLHLKTRAQKEKMMQYITGNMAGNNGSFKLDVKCKWALLWWEK